MRYAVLGMIVLFALGDGCSPAPGVVGVQDYGQVAGRVLDAMTNRPIPNALVSVGSLYTTSADAQGGFTLNHVPEGDQTITARAPGYTTATSDTTVKKESTVSIGYIRLVPVIHPNGMATLAPPPTPAPATPTPEASVAPSGAPSEAPSGTPATPAEPATTAVPASTPTPVPPSPGPGAT